MPNETLPTPARRVVLVDARAERRELMRRVVEGDSATAVLVGEADGTAAALTVIDEQQADVVVLDVQMPIADGLATIAALRERHPQLGIIVCSFDVDRTTVQRVLEQGADLFLAKPVRQADVHAAFIGLPHHDRTADGGPAAPVAALAAAAC